MDNFNVQSIAFLPNEIIMTIIPTELFQLNNNCWLADTFHEVKRKHDRRKGVRYIVLSEITSSFVFVPGFVLLVFLARSSCSLMLVSLLTLQAQDRGARGGRGSYSGKNFYPD